VFELENRSEDKQANEIRNKKDTSIFASPQSGIGNSSVQPLLNPQERKPNETGTVSNCFKAAFGQITQDKLFVVVILPFSVPDNICHFAAQEITMSFNQ
jgi:hypothetical protein